MLTVATGIVLIISIVVLAVSLYARGEVLYKLGMVFWVGFIPCLGAFAVCEAVEAPRPLRVAAAALPIAGALLLLIGLEETFIAGLLCFLAFAVCMIPSCIELSGMCDHGEWFGVVLALVPVVGWPLVAFHPDFQVKA